MSGIKVDGVWRVPGLVHAKVGNTWRIGATTHTKVDGSWKITTFGAPPAKPQFNFTTDPATTSHVAAGTFRIRNYDPTLVYSDTRVGGTGTATRTGSDYVLSASPSSFNITAAYATGAPQSVAGYVERLAYTFSPTPPSCFPNPPSCFDNCGVSYDCSGPAGFPGCIPCWGFGPDGTFTGGVCCGGSRGQTCNPTPPSCFPNPPTRNPTPPGYLDSFGEWWRVS